FSRLESGFHQHILSYNSTLYAAVCILAERFFYFTGKQFPVKKDLFPNFENEVFTMSLLFLKEK
ncbi:hypothetical protein DWX96_02635, partial [Roseburia sp. AF22-2LB]